MTDTFSIARLYVATFNRAADAEGLTYWSGDIGFSIEQIAESFFDQPETQALYPDILSDEVFVSTIYHNLFNREGDAEGIAYWSEKLSEGSISRSKMILAFINGAQGDDALIVQHKGGAALYYAECGLNDAGLAHEAVQGIGPDVNSLQQAKNRIDGMDTEHLDGLGVLPSEEMYQVKALQSGDAWEGDVITYSFNKVIPPEYYSESEKLTDNWHPFDSTEEQIVRDIFNRLGNELAITFSEVENEGDIRFNKVDMQEGNVGFSYFPSDDNDPISGDVFISNNYDVSGGHAAGSDGWLTILHEIGHALGLKHPFEGTYQLPSSEDNTEYTVMTYTAKEVTGIDFSYASGECRASFPFDASPDAFQLYDVMALQALYGANTSYASEADRYDLSLLARDKGHMLVWDSAGNDTLHLSETTGNNRISLKEGTLSSVDPRPVEVQKEEAIAYYVSQGCSETGAQDWIESVYSDPEVLQYLYTGEDNLAIAQGVLIENVISGSGDDIIYGNSLDNFIEGGEGDDRIYLSEGGYDIVLGGSGNDSVYVEDAASQYLLRDMESERWLLESLDGKGVYVELWDVETLVFNNDETLMLV